MTTDVNVQFLSHLNGIVLGNNWGDMIRLLDTCLVNGLPFTSITSASIDANGDINLTLYSAHNALLFQVVELSGFSPSGINGKYRIKGVPTSNQLILKAQLAGQAIIVNGTAKLASLNYEIVFRDLNDVKRVYRAKNPRAEHPFIRVDETISDGTNSYNSAYAKSAMIGLLENMTHIDDYEDPDKLQLPLDTTDFKKNWKISGTGSGVIRGWSRWYWARGVELYNYGSDAEAPVSSSRAFTLCGDNDAFYILPAITGTSSFKQVLGCGLFNSSYDNSVIANWFLMTLPLQTSANTSFEGASVEAGWPLMYQELCSKFLVLKHDIVSRINSNIFATPILPNFKSGATSMFSGTSIAALEIPFFDSENKLRGTLKHIKYAGGFVNKVISTPYISDSSMYVYDGSNVSSNNTGGVYFYLGELE